MKLSELEPKLTDGQLRFRCPGCREHFIVIPVDREGSGTSIPPVWTARGELETLTVAPSIDAITPPCRWHGWIVDGEVRNA